MVVLIDKVWCAVAVDPEDQTEGVCAHLVNKTWMPLIAADENRLAQIIPIARGIADQSGQTILIVKLSAREIVEVIEPEGKS